MTDAEANNCAVVAIAAITGEAHQDIVAGISAFPNKAGQPAFVGDGVWVTSVSAYLEARGWTELFFEDRPSIPWTCLISVGDHFFAVVDGCIFDRSAGNYFATPIISIFVPPPGGMGKNRQRRSP